MAGRVAIKQLGTNGGGFFNVNSRASSFENYTPIGNFVENWAIPVRAVLRLHGRWCVRLGGADPSWAPPDPECQSRQCHSEARAARGWMRWG